MQQLCSCPSQPWRNKAFCRTALKNRDEICTIRCSEMRPGHVIVLAVLMICLCTRTWGKEETSEKEFAEQTASSPQRRSILSMRFFDAISCAYYGPRKIHRVNLVCKRRFAERQHINAYPLDVSNVVIGGKSVQTDTSQVRLSKQYAHMQACGSACLSRDVVNRGDRRKLNEAPSKGHTALPHKHVTQSLSHINVQDAMRRMSLLDVLDETTADMEANAVRRQGVDSSLLRYAGLTLSADTETGSIYDVELPPSLAGISAQVMRIAPSSLEQVGLAFNEFTIPMGAVFIPSSDYVALVYRIISSFTVYTLPPDYIFGGPVVGIMSASSNSTTIDPSLPTGSISLPANSYISISLPVYSGRPNGDVLCAFFAVNGSIFLSNLVSNPSNCVSSTFGDFALLVRSSATTSPAQSGSPPSTTGSPNNAGSHSSSSPHAKSSAKWKLIVGATCLAIIGLGLLIAVALVSIKLTENVKRFLATRHYTGNDEALQDSLVGGSIAPSAPVMRTKPALEIDAARFSH